MASTDMENKMPDVLTALGFAPLSESISLYKPIRKLLEMKTSTSPTLIIICSWAFAQPKHITKYIKPYQDCFPTASILLVQNVIANMIWRSDRFQMSFFQPAEAAIQAHVQSVDRSRILLHAFSNGGSYAAVQLSQACRETCRGLRLPIDALILDSCPAPPRFFPIVTALTQGLPSKNPIVRAIAKTLAYGAASGTALCEFLNISEPAFRKLYRKLNDPDDVFLLDSPRSDKASVVPRTYICSESDTMVSIEDVKEHARIAAQTLASAGFDKDTISQNVRLEVFVGSTHVNHVKIEGERYWDVISQTWAKVS